MGNRLDCLEAGTEARDRLAVPFELAIGKIGNIEIGDPAKRRTAQLGADIGLARVWRDKKQPGGGMKIIAAQCEIEHADNS